MARQTNAADQDSASAGAVVLFQDGSIRAFETAEEARDAFPRAWVMTAEEYADYQASQADDADEPDAPDGDG